MNVSPIHVVREMYESTADDYSNMMDSEIDLPVYTETFNRLHQRILNTPGPLIDTSCGSGHMLLKYREKFDPDRELIGFDLSPRMVEIAKLKLGPKAQVHVGDMRNLDRVESDIAAVVVSFFAIHHLDSSEVVPTLEEWRRILRPGGQLLAATWEGEGAIDYGNETDVVAFRYTREQAVKWLGSAGFHVDRCDVEPVEGFPMDAIYFEGTNK